MGVKANIDYETFPKQGGWLGARCKVVFKYDTTKELGGTYVRDDREDPHVQIIRLDDGRHVLTTECQHAPDTSSRN